MYSEDTARFDHLADLPALGLSMNRNDEFRNLLMYSRPNKGYSHRTHNICFG